MNAPLPKAPINWIGVFALVLLPIIAVIAIPLYAYHHDFSMAAWISLFVLLGL
ncbi:MAG: acyl-CoA desaturase, partial [Acinetobacter sp.]